MSCQLWDAYLCRKPLGAGSSCILMQRASNSKHVEVEGLQLVTSVVKRLQLARPKLPGLVGGSLRKLA